MRLIWQANHSKELIDELFDSKIELRLIAKAFKEYKAAGKTMEDFEEDYGCTVEFDDIHSGIKGISFQNDSCETAFMLKYKT